MLTVAAEADIKAPPAVVWQVLADFGSFPRWTAAATLDRSPDRPDELTYAIRVTARGGGVRPWAFVGRLRTLEPPQRLAWTAGLPGILTLAVSFDLGAWGGHTHVRHEARLSGLVAWIRPGLMRRIFQSVVDRTLRDLDAEVRRVRRGGPRPFVAAPGRPGRGGRPGR